MGSMYQIRQQFSGQARFVVGRDRRGRWVVSDRRERVGGVFTSEAAAIHFAVEECNGHAEEVCRAPEGITVDLAIFRRGR
ncbi:hypothetical protein [Sinorhizobium chiapasense]|uniref:DUF2188 domain-containing protein n=1 Tax=Sinorhizobium chiapasense TaxID=501572 RepID=A0ABZ2BBY9_9HYPH